MNRLSKFLLVLAVVVAIFTRFWHLTTIPYPPDGDEVAFGYYGWSLLHFGTDEFGKVLPTSFSSIGDFKYPGLAYLNIIPAAFFGLSNIEIRIWNALAGVFLVILIYLLAQFLFRNKKIALFAAWAVALSPWAITVSRRAFETSIATVLVTAGITSLLYGTAAKDKKTKYFLLASAFFVFLIAAFTYAAARFFIPAFLALLLILAFIKGGFMPSSKKIISLFMISLSVIILSSLLSPINRGRAADDIWHGLTGIESNRLQELYIQAGTSQIRLPPRVTWFFNNKYRIALFDFIDRYAEHFNVGYLFTGSAYGQEIPDTGVLFLTDLLFLPFGLVALLKNKDKKNSVIILGWLLLAPVPSALTVNSAKMLRASLLIVPFAILSGLGFNYITNLAKTAKNWVTLILIAAFAISALYTLNQIFVQKPLDKPWLKQTVNQQLTQTIIKLKDKYKAVAASDDDYIFFLFYGKISPADFQKRASIEPTSKTKWARVVRLDNIYFNMPYKCPKGGELSVLYVCQGVEVPQNAKIIDTFYYPDGVPAYSLIEFYPESQMPSVSNRIPLPSKFQYMVDVEHSYPDGIIPSESSSLW